MKTQNKKLSLIYWISTGLLALFILPGIFFINSPVATAGTTHLGIPHWLAMEIGIGHFIGGLIIVLPFISSRIKEWAYVGLGIKYISAIIAHLVIDGFVADSFSPLLILAITVVSYMAHHRRLELANA